jgi:alkylglycerol monooxygenase
METYGKILVIATPIFLLLVLSEKLYGWIVRRDSFNSMDTISSMSSGCTNSIKDVLQLSISIISYEWMYQNLAVYKVESSILVGTIAFVSLDLSGYWVHRLSHQINFFWNKHAIHHSSEEFNLACALRQSVSSFVSLFTIFLLPAALLGVEPKIIAIIAPLHLFAQLWYHTVYINKMGFLEKIIVTPSHHRVHHAINPEYMDKNHGQIFIFWDKLFGTFQEELPHVPPVYGITRPARTWNPIKINFQHLWLMIKDAYYAQSWKDKLRIWGMPTGWRPADVAQRFPEHKINDPYHFEKYQTNNSNLMIGWSWFQFLTTLLLMAYFFGNVVKIGTPNMFYYGGFIFLTVFSYTELMDKNPYALAWEILRLVVGFGLIYYLGDWFGINAQYTWGTTAVMAYLVLSALATTAFVFFEIRGNHAFSSKTLQV